jgi:tRNA-uridine 2-sulfurtransferase
VRVLVAMSGGVDSSVAAAVLRDEGHEVTGVTLKLWGGESDSGCCSVSDVDDARRVAAQLGIDHHVFNLGDDFHAHVVDPYVAAHAAGLTPNPCIECNRHVKFDRLMLRAEALGFDAVATGHHARVEPVGGRHFVTRGADRAKDQSYVVHMLTPDVISRTLFPIGDMTKEIVRSRAADLGLRTATKPDSQDVCFIARSSGGREAFLGERITRRPATVRDLSGTVVGELPAVELVTIGQRRGIAAGGHGERRYVVDVDVAGATVTVGELDDLLVGTQPTSGFVWTHGEPTGVVRVQTSAHGDARPATVDGGRVVWAERQRRVAPGQAIVVYDDSDTRVLGAATAA